MNDKTSSPDPNDPKILVDEDWKSQVQAEKRAAAERSPEAPEGARQDLPPASFESLVTMLSLQVLASLGGDPGRQPDQQRVDLPAAKFYIDSLDLLEAKTKGNLTPDEQGVLASTLHQLRMMYVSVASHPPAAPEEQTPRSSTLELP